MKKFSLKGQYKLEPAHLIEGKPYMVKHDGGKAFVRRIFKYKEKRFEKIDCFVFTGKVSKTTSATVDSRGTDGIPLYRYSGLRNLPAQEISIPYYDLKDIKEA